MFCRGPPEGSSWRWDPSMRLKWREELMSDDFRAQITREDILEAIKALDRGEVHVFGPSTFYDVLEAGRRYPPKAVVGLAARRVLGRTLRPDEFSGGEESWAFRLLRDRGFSVVKKRRNNDATELPIVPTAPVWIEDTYAGAHDHGGLGWEFGTCLWSPSSAEGGIDWYSLMREPKPGDFVIHFNDGVIVGWSRVAESFQELTEAPPKSSYVGGTAIVLPSRTDGLSRFPAKSFAIRIHSSSPRCVNGRDSK